MQSSLLLRIAKLATLVWLMALIAVLIFGLRAAQYAGGEVAMQMFVLTFPASIAVGGILNEISYSPSYMYGVWHVALVWLPFFIGGLIQAVAIWGAVIVFAANGSRSPLTLHSSGSPSAPLNSNVRVHRFY